MIEIPLSQGLVAMIDDEDYALVANFAWHATKRRHGYYAVTNKLRPHRGTIYMHRLLTGAVSGQEVDHKNVNGLDNRRGNLRIATRSKNNGNQRKTKRPVTSRFKGPSWRADGQCWQCHISVNDRSIYLGRFKREEDAALAYNFAALEHFGEFARLNVERELSGQYDPSRFDDLIAMGAP